METEPLTLVDATPDENYPIRILEAHLKTARTRWSQKNFPIKNLESKVVEILNGAQEKRVVLLENAISKLRSNVTAQRTPGETLTEGD